MMEKHSKITSFIVLMVFCVFALSILAVLLSGAGIYKKLVERETMHFDRRTVPQYLTTRLHQADLAERVLVRDFDGCSALVLTEEIDGSLYETCVYCWDGYVRELFTVSGGTFSPGDGERILEAESLVFSLSENMLSVRLTLKDGTKQEFTRFLRSGREVPDEG